MRRVKLKSSMASAKRYCRGRITPNKHWVDGCLAGVDEMGYTLVNRGMADSMSGTKKRKR